ncbi:GAF domain-containing protein [Nonomuraea sp. NN258]|uniref:helix-turn-helix transcriptional regulator n=1 Tax=Nonomuraea antri TaxID=2730852 RepID=UPI00156872D0|nr:LuxR C-terminal-related transcriptional regulator [Nonomuraea antri]NRQ37881.1 GAF domain-containing protein [Nonomuraea antri]
MAVTPLPSDALASCLGVLLRTTVGGLRQATGLAVAFGGAIVQDGHDVRLTAMAGTRTDALRGLLIRTGHGLGGRVLLTTRPGSVADYAADARISHEYDRPVRAEGLRAVVAVPVRLGESVCGLLYGGIREPLPLGARVVDAMARAAARMEVELAVRAEVERRLAALETEAITRAARESAAGPGWEQLREARAELRSIAQEVTDPGLRDRLRGVCDRLVASPGAAAPPNPLSPRELDVLALIAVGCGNAEAGRRLGLRPETIKSYLRSAMRKLGTHTRTETVVSARRAGFLA